MATIHGTAGQDTVLAPHRRQRRWPWLVAGSLALLLLMVMAWPAMSRWSHSERSVSRAALRTAQVTRGHFTSDVTAQGRAVAAVSPTLYRRQQQGARRPF
jgi:HlyD family secretion protein